MATLHIVRHAKQSQPPFGSLPGLSTAQHHQPCAHPRQLSVALQQRASSLCFSQSDSYSPPSLSQSDRVTCQPGRLTDTQHHMWTRGPAFQLVPAPAAYHQSRTLAAPSARWNHSQPGLTQASRQHPTCECLTAVALPVTSQPQHVASPPQEGGCVWQEQCFASQGLSRCSSLAGLAPQFSIFWALGGQQQQQGCESTCNKASMVKPRERVG